MIDFGKLELYAGVTEDFPFSIPLFESDDETTAEFAADDVVYFVLSSRTKAEPTAAVLTIASDAATANKSKVFVTDRGDAITGDPAVGYVRFAQDDTAALVADWDDDVYSQLLIGELWFIDNSETEPADARKLIGRGEILLRRTGAL